jgi:SH3-like domain-containing protein
MSEVYRGNYSKEVGQASEQIKEKTYVGSSVTPMKSWRSMRDLGGGEGPIRRAALRGRTTEWMGIASGAKKMAIGWSRRSATE